MEWLVPELVARYKTHANAFQRNAVKIMETSTFRLTWQMMSMLLLVHLDILDVG